MKNYIRTKDGHILKYRGKQERFDGEYDTWYQGGGISILYNFNHDLIVKEADTIEELCDEFVCQENDNFYWLASRENVSFRDLPNCYCKAIFGAIWTDKGLIYVAKMNEKGEFELL